MKHFLLIGVIGLLAACASSRVLQAESAPGADFTKYKSFDFYQVSASGDTIKSVFGDRLRMLKLAIVEEMTKRGYRQQSYHPDLWINIGIQVTAEMQTRETNWQTDGAPRYMGQRNYSWKSQQVPIGVYREGTISLDLVEAASNEQIWKGVVKGVEPRKQSNMQAVIQESMKNLFLQFPTGKPSGD